MTLWGNTRQERQHLVWTVRSLGTASVPGIAAALSISERKAVKLLRETFRLGPPGLAWDNGSRTVSYLPPSYDRSTAFAIPPATAVEAPSSTTPSGPTASDGS